MLKERISFSELSLFFVQEKIPVTKSKTVINFKICRLIVLIFRVYLTKYGKDNTFILQFNHSYKIFFETPENFPK